MILVGFVRGDSLLQSIPVELRDRWSPLDAPNYSTWVRHLDTSDEVEPGLEETIRNEGRCSPEGDQRRLVGGRIEGRSQATVDERRLWRGAGFDRQTTG